MVFDEIVLLLCSFFVSSKDVFLVLRLVSVQIVRENQLNSCSNHSKSWVLGSPAAVYIFCVCNEKKVGAVVKGKWYFFVWRDAYFLTFLKKKYTFSLKISDFWWNRIASIFGIFFLKDKNYVLQFISAQMFMKILSFSWKSNYAPITFDAEGFLGLESRSNFYKTHKKYFCHTRLNLSDLCFFSQKASSKMALLTVYFCSSRKLKIVLKQKPFEKIFGFLKIHFVF